MDNMEMLLEPIRASLHLIGEFLPRVLLAIAILIVGWLLAKALRFAVVKTLRAINFSVVTEKAGIDKFLQQGGGEIGTTEVLGLLAYWLVVLAALIVAFGAYFARFVGSAVTTYGRNVGVGEAKTLGRIAHYAIMIFVVLIALDQLGLGDIIRQTFLIIIAAVALGLALAFGLGGQKRAAELLERWSRRKDDDGGRPASTPPPF